MAGLPIIDSGGTLIAANGYEIPNAAVTLIDFGVSQLWIPTLIGSNREVIDGHVSVASRIKEQSVDVPLLVTGEVDSDGNPQTGGLPGLWENVEELRSVWLDPSLTGDGTQQVTFEPFPGGPVLSGRVKCTGITLADPWPGSWRVALHLVLPDGPLVEVAS